MTRSGVRSVCALGIAAVVVGLLVFTNQEPDYSKVQVSNVADLERELGRLQARLGIPGMGAAIALGSRVVWAQGFGWANLERRLRINPETTSFHLASVTKPYTATVLLQLADEGRLDLDSPVSRFGVDMPSDEPVRVWHLLSHTSGGTPGTAFRYDARAFRALTTVVERTSDRPFAAELTDRIVRKLAARGESLASHRDGRGAPPARRDDREYREYLVRHEGAEDQWMKDPPE